MSHGTKCPVEAHRNGFSRREWLPDQISWRLLDQQMSSFEQFDFIRRIKQPRGIVAANTTHLQTASRIQVGLHSPEPVEISMRPRANMAITRWSIKRYAT